MESSSSRNLYRGGQMADKSRANNDSESSQDLLNFYAGLTKEDETSSDMGLNGVAGEGKCLFEHYPTHPPPQQLKAGDVKQSQNACCGVPPCAMSAEEEKCEMSADVWCDGCNLPFCHNCFCDVHKKGPISRHKKVPYETFRIFDQTLNFKNFPSNEHANPLAFVNSTDHHVAIREGGLARVIDGWFGEGCFPSIISLVGPSGVGKSFITRILHHLLKLKNQGMIRFPADETVTILPTPADTGAVTSTSSDLHMYLGSVVPDPSGGSPAPCVFFDTEGIRGSSSPSTLQMTIDRFTGDLGVGAKNAFLKARIRHVEETYPKLVYVFSDVVCFVTDCDWKAKGSIIQPLLTWAKAATAGVKNQACRPKLIIVFTKGNPEDFKGNLETNVLTNLFMNSDHELDELYQYYTNPQVICIPNGKRDSVLLQDQFSQLLDIILNGMFELRAKRLSVGQLLCCNDLSKYFRHAVKSFNLKQPFDFRPDLSLEDGTVRLESYFLDLEKEIGFENAVALLQRRMSIVPLLHYLRRSEAWGLPCGPGQRVPTEPFEAICHALDEKVANYSPCLATKTFTCSNNGEVIASCSCSLKVHESQDPGQHLSFSTYFKTRTWAGYLSREAVRQACRWPGDFEGRKWTPNFFTRAHERLQSYTAWNPTLVLQDLRSLLIETSAVHTKLPKTHKYCCGCLLNAPTETLLCSHILCFDCCKIMEKDEHGLPMCLICQCPVPWKPLPSSNSEIGYRILALDGGGVKGMVEVTVLIKIEEILGIPIRQCFDFIIGTSTGSIITAILGYTSAPLKNCYNVAFNASMAAFGSPLFLVDVAFVGYIFRGFVWGHKYDPTKFKKFLMDELEDQEKKKTPPRVLFGCAHQGLKVAITSCLSKETFPTVLFTSYNRHISESDIDDPLARVEDILPTCTVVDAVLASSAAATFFPSHLIDDLTFTDGGMRNNCPAELGIAECKKIWGVKAICNFVLRVGTGRLDVSTHSYAPVNDTISFLNNTVNIAVDAQIIWDRVENTFTDDSTEVNSRNNRALCINPLLQTPCALDEKDKIETLAKETENYFVTHDGKAELYKVASRVFSSLFYLSLVSDVLDKVQLNLLSRIPIPYPSRKLLRGISVKILEVPDVNFEYSMAWDDEGILSSTISIVGLPVVRPLRVLVFADIAFDGYATALQSVISGCPFVINSRA